MKCSTSFLLFTAPPNQAVKWPLADTPPGFVGVMVACPVIVPVAQLSSPFAKKVTWKIELPGR